MLADTQPLFLLFFSFLQSPFAARCTVDHNLLRLPVLPFFPLLPLLLPTLDAVPPVPQAETRAYLSHTRDLLPPYHDDYKIVTQAQVKAWKERQIARQNKSQKGQIMWKKKKRKLKVG